MKTLHRGPVSHEHQYRPLDDRACRSYEFFLSLVHTHDRAQS